eukprot:184653-Chlamydomonas_euryale.AAC.5
MQPSHAVAPSMHEMQSNFSVNIDLLQFLGHQQFFSGISWDPVMCMPSWKVRGGWYRIGLDNNWLACLCVLYENTQERLEHEHTCMSFLLTV